VKEDFPAAHSMDTNWFAVDEQGNIASFDSGEAGAVPHERSPESDIDSDSFFQQLVGLGDLSLYRFDADFLIDQADHKLYQLTYHDPVTVGGLTQEMSFSELETVAWRSLIIWLDPDTPDQLFRSFGVRLSTESEKLIMVPEANVARARSLCESRHFLRGCLMYNIPPARFGVYDYHHGDEFENWISGPYVQNVGEPRYVLNFERLPRKFRDEFLSTRLRDVNFSEDMLVQPLELTNCSTWQDRWIATDGSRHSIGEETTE
jgi:hypothetical protein